MDLPDRAGAAPPAAPLPVLQPGVPGGLRGPAVPREAAAPNLLSSPAMATTVAVVGLGRVGLPLALSFADRGLDVIGIDKEPRVLESIRDCRMPFHETGTQDVLERVIASGRLSLSERLDAAAAADHIVLTLGTPAHVHIEIDISQIRGAVDELMPLLRPGQSIILRSTVAPGTTDWVAGYLEQRRGFEPG